MIANRRLMRPKLGMFATISSSISLLPLIGFLAFFCGICGLLSLAGGWHGLSKIYPDTKSSGNRSSRWQSISIGGVSYGRGSVNVGISATGVHLKTLWTFRFLHPPILIPWSEIKLITMKTWLFYTRYQVTLKQTGTVIYFYGSLGGAILREWQERSLPVAFGDPGNK